MKSKFEAFAKTNIDAMLQDIGKLVAVRSVRGEAESGMPFGRGPALAGETMMDIAKTHGFSACNVDNYAIEINLNEGEDELGILCHLDVVDEGVGWTTPPYQMDIREGRIYGRGVADNKGPAVAALYALKCVRESGIELKKNVRLILGMDEECGCTDIVEYFKRRPQPKFCFSPDAAFPVYNVEKGRYSPQLTGKFEACTTGARVIKIRSGEAGNIVPCEAQATLAGISIEEAKAAVIAEITGAQYEIMPGKNGTLLLLVRGLSAHAAYPEDGNNALTALLALIGSFDLAQCTGHMLLKKLNELIPHGDYHGRNIGISMADEVSGELTCNLAVLDYDGESLSAKLDLRCPVCSTTENTADVFRAIFEKAGFTVAGEAMIAPHYVPEDQPFIRILMRAFEEYTNLPGECVSMGGGTYVHGLKNSVAFGAAFPDTDTFAHSPDEYAVISELEACVGIFAQVIVDMCS